MKFSIMTAKRTNSSSYWSIISCSNHTPQNAFE